MKCVRHEQASKVRDQMSGLVLRSVVQKKPTKKPSGLINKKPVMGSRFNSAYFLHFQQQLRAVDLVVPLIKFHQGLRSFRWNTVIGNLQSFSELRVKGARDLIVASIGPNKTLEP